MKPLKIGALIGLYSNSFKVSATTVSYQTGALLSFLKMLNIGKHISAIMTEYNDEEMKYEARIYYNDNQEK